MLALVGDRYSLAGSHEQATLRAFTLSTYTHVRVSSRRDARDPITLDETLVYMIMKRRRQN